MVMGSRTRGEARSEIDMKSVDVSDAEIEAAYGRHKQRLVTEPLAVAVRYHRGNDTVVVEINNGAALIIPRRLMQGLRHATADALRNGIVTGDGTTLTWPALDADFTVMSLLRGVFGGPRWMSELARLAGATTSPAKAAAARANGRKGGRPRQSGPRTHRASARKR